MAQLGYSYLVRVKTQENPEQWDALRIRGGSFPELTQRRGTVDITAHGDASIPFRSHLATLYEAQELTVTVLSGGDTEQQRAFTFLQGKLGSDNTVEIRVVDSSTNPETVVWQGSYLVTGFTLRAPLEDAVTYDVTLMLTGQPTTHFGS